METLAAIYNSAIFTILACIAKGANGHYLEFSQSRDISSAI